MSHGFPSCLPPFEIFANPLNADYGRFLMARYPLFPCYLLFLMNLRSSLVRAGCCILTGLSGALKKPHYANLVFYRMRLAALLRPSLVRSLDYPTSVFPFDPRGGGGNGSRGELLLLTAHRSSGRLSVCYVYHTFVISPSPNFKRDRLD